MSGVKERRGDTAQQLLPRHRYMLQKVDAAFGIYDESSTEIMFLQSGVIDKVSAHVRRAYRPYWPLLCLGRNLHVSQAGGVHRENERQATGLLMCTSAPHVHKCTSYAQVHRVYGVFNGTFLNGSISNRILRARLKPSSLCPCFKSCSVCTLF